jgi:hypothetical protein
MPALDRANEHAGRHARYQSRRRRK